MARPSRRRVIDSSDEADESFPDFAALIRHKKAPISGTPEDRVGSSTGTRTEKSAKAPASMRRRKLGPISDNTLLRGWTPDATQVRADVQFCADEKEKKVRRPRVELRSRKSKPANATPTSINEDEDDYVSAQEEVTITEEVSLAEDAFDSPVSEGSEFENSLDDFIVDDEDDDDSVTEILPNRPPPKPRLRGKEQIWTQSITRTKSIDKHDTAVEGLAPNSQTKGPGGQKKTQATRAPKETKKRGEKDLTDAFSGLQLNETLASPEAEPKKIPRRKQTPPLTPPKSKPGLVSPKKLSRIPATPHRPSSDIFWSQEFVDDWNDEHSPRKQLFPDPSKASASKKAAPEKKNLPSARQSKKAFEKAKHDLAASFLQELDTVITDGQLSSLAVSTGGIKLVWTNKLNTTAGRANWKRETLRTNHPPTVGGKLDSATVRHKHHASIELAEKVIDDEHRLLNVIAHEFCHLANFMISGVTTNPHGREFKAWAAKCSRAFGDRGIEVTTKHSYDIDFKYVWECADCGMEYKRHSKSVNPERHRCGGCRGQLKQTKPVPRGGAAKGDGAKKAPSEYQIFMKEEMKRVREENPGSPQKDIMKMVASRWSQRQAGRATPTAKLTPDGVDEVVKGMEELGVSR